MLPDHAQRSGTRISGILECHGAPSHVRRTLLQQQHTHTHLHKSVRVVCGKVDAPDAIDSRHAQHRLSIEIDIDARPCLPAGVSPSDLLPIPSPGSAA